MGNENSDNTDGELGVNRFTSAPGGELRDIDYGTLDPGIREFVRLLNGAGFVTTDSGDGCCKGEFGEPYPHVHIVLASDADMVAEAGRLLGFVRQAADVPEGLLVQSSYSPIDGLKTLHVFNVADCHLRAALVQSGKGE